MTSPSSQPPAATYRIGAISHLSGVPVSTLRIWEVRYGTFQPVKSEGNQRLYTEDDALKATLLKQLVQSGYPIASIARHDTAGLNHLLQKNAPPSLAALQRPADTPIPTLIVGTTLALRLNSTTISHQPWRENIKVEKICTDLPSALGEKELPPCSLLMLRVQSLHTLVQQEIEQLQQRCGASTLVVVYHFGQQWVIDSMKHAGAWVRREPLSDTDWGDLLQGVIKQPLPSPSPTRLTVAPRKYSDETLAEVANSPNKVACECPRHVAEILTALASFEQYSRDCQNRNTNDAHLHAELHRITGAARTLFEEALEKIAVHEGIVLQTAT